jgi:hypothetical protein
LYLHLPPAQFLAFKHVLYWDFASIAQSDVKEMCWHQIAASHQRETLEIYTTSTSTYSMKSKT